MEKLVQKYSTRITEILLYFFIYSFIGWITEEFFSYIVLGHFDNRGFLFGPICPIYGFGMLIIIFMLSQYKDNTIKLFFVSAIVLTYLEYATSYLLDSFFHLKWWDYTSDLFNINGRISLYYSIAWGFFAIIFINYVHPSLSKAVYFLENNFKFIFNKSIIILLFIIAIIDFILSTLQHLEINIFF